jgi:predicted nuclease of predicted toxin-antitoxin system
MPKTIHFHLDENCNLAIAEGLRRRGVDVTTTPEVGLLTADDVTQLAHALAERRVVFTQDRDFLRHHAAGVSHAGIVYCDKDTLSIGEIIRGILLIWEVYDSEEMTGQVEYLAS